MRERGGKDKEGERVYVQGKKRDMYEGFSVCVCV